MRLRRHRPMSLALLAVAVMLTGCATTQPPPAEISASRQAIRQAEQVGARDLASSELRSAERKLEMAEAASEQKRYDRATRLAQQALVDAELAEVRARSARAQSAAHELQESIRTLREEIERGARSDN